MTSSLPIVILALCSACAGARPQHPPGLVLPPRAATAVGGSQLLPHLVGLSLAERETLLRAMPHISWPMRFVLPYHKDMRFENDTPTSKLLSTVMPWMKGRRPAWLIRFGLFLYDPLG